MTDANQIGMSAQNAAVTSELDVVVGDAKLKVRSILLSDGAPTIVFLHDSLGCITLWRDFPDQLCAAAGCNALIYDRQGYGLSSPFTRARGLNYLEQEAEVLMQLLTAVNQWHKYILFGHSDGGSIALLAAARVSNVSPPSPLRISAVISEGAHVFVEEISLNGIRAAVAQKNELLPRVRKYHGDKAEAVFDAWAKTWLRPEFRNFNMEHFLPQITCPVMVIQGEADEYGTEKQVDAIAGQVKGFSKKLLVPGVGHTPHRDATNFVLKECVDFISKHVK